ncbi:MAG: GspH/FimT family protein [Methylococcaceae bacterium]
MINKHHTGFTLVELLVTLTLAATLLAIGMPSFKETIRKDRLVSISNHLIGSFNLAHDEAVKRLTPVTVRKEDPFWEKGWIIFADVNGNGTFNDNGNTDLCEPNEDCLLKQYPAIANHYTLRSNSTAFVNRVTYLPSGKTNSTMGSFIACGNTDQNNLPEPHTSRLIIINRLGRTRIGRDNDLNGIPEKDNGKEVIHCTQSPFFAS